MKRLIDILIISAILLGVTFCFGCKEKAYEPEAPNEFIFEPYSTNPSIDRVVWIDDEDWPPKFIKVSNGAQTIRYLPEPNEPNEPNDNFAITFTADLNDNTIISDTTISLVISEPEEAQFNYIDSSGETVFECSYKDFANWSDAELVKFATFLSLAKMHCWNHPEEQKAIEKIALRMIPKRLMGGEPNEPEGDFALSYTLPEPNEPRPKSSIINSFLLEPEIDPNCGNKSLNPNYEEFKRQFQKYYPEINESYTRDIEEWLGPNIIYLATLLLDKRLNELEKKLIPPPEPNEPETLTFDATNAEIKIISKCPKCGYDFHTEPNEPEEQYFHIWEPQESNIITLDFIPTWPEYIELEKDFVIEYEYDTGFVEYAGPTDDKFSGVKTKKVMQKAQYHFPKGTKIYFKEDE